MTFYILTFAAKVDAQGLPVTQEADGSRVVKEINIWDERSVTEFSADYVKDRVLHLRKLGYQHSPGRPLEWRGEISVYAPYLIAIDVDLKAELKQKAGPVEFMPRPPRESAP